MQFKDVQANHGFPRDSVDANHCTTSLLPVALLTGSCHCPRGIKLKGESRQKAKGKGPRARGQAPIFSSGICHLHPALQWIMLRLRGMLVQWLFFLHVV